MGQYGSKNDLLRYKAFKNKICDCAENQFKSGEGTIKVLRHQRGWWVGLKKSKT